MKNIKIYSSLKGNKRFKLVVGSLVVVSMLVTFTRCSDKKIEEDSNVHIVYKDFPEFDPHENLDKPSYLYISDEQFSDIDLGVNYPAVLDGEKKVNISFELILTDFKFDSSNTMDARHSVCAYIFSYEENINERIDLNSGKYEVSISSSNENALVFDIKHREKYKIY